VGEMRRQPLVRMANLDDEMSLSTDGISLSDETDEDEEDVDQPISAPLGRDKDKTRSEVLLGSCSSLIGPNGHEDTPSSRGAVSIGLTQFRQALALWEMVRKETADGQ
ncbi:hypothetical protein TELCIR_20560, partial [Teladorsagia circumcincta]